MSLVPITRDQALRDAIVALERLRDTCTSLNDAGTAETAIDCLRRLDRSAAQQPSGLSGRFQWGSGR